MKKDYKELVTYILKEDYEQEKYGYKVSDINIVSFNSQNIDLTYKTEREKNIVTNRWHYTGDKAKEIFIKFDNLKQ